MNEGLAVGFSSIKSGIEELKLHFPYVCDIVGVGVKENKETVADIRYISNQIGCQDSRIDDLERDSRELMGPVDVIKEEVLKMAKMSQCSHCQESPVDGDRPMEEASVTQPALGLVGKKS